MEIPIPQPTLDARFAERFLGLFFSRQDQVVLCRDISGVWSNVLHPFDAAVAYVANNRDQPNIYFRLSVFDGRWLWKTENCVSTNALIVDLDYGTEGHGKGKKPRFQDEDDAAAYLLTFPLRATVAWHTGHGLQAAFILTEPYVFNPEKLKRYLDVSKSFSAMLLSDSTHTPEHAFRFPLTLNSKKHKNPDWADVSGQLLWLDEQRRYGFEEIAALVQDYDIPDQQEQVAVEPSVEKYEDLPQALRNDIEVTSGESSDRLYGVIYSLLQRGWDQNAILAALEHGKHITVKFRGREGGIQQEVANCIQKITTGKVVYVDALVPPVVIYNAPVPVPLSECRELPATLQAMLAKYAAVTGAVITPGLSAGMRFHDHLYETHACGVMESMCGSGKSTWAICKMATAASGQHFIYVTQTVDMLYTVADVLAQLTAVSVGRVHGFNEARCEQLCHTRHTWQECDGGTSSVCHRCTAASACCYFNRDRESRQPLVCMTHAGFIRAMECRSEILTGASIIIDEELDTFTSWTVTLPELERLRALSAIDLSPVFPNSRVGDLAVRAWRLNATARTYAGRHYLYRNEQQTSALRNLYNSLCKQAAINPSHTFAHSQHTQAMDTLMELLNFIRPSAAGDATYAFRETLDAQNQIAYTAKRNRIRLDALPEVPNLWILNASAQLSPHPYPDNLPVFSCPDLPDNSDKVVVNVVRGNPTKSKQKEQLALSRAILSYGPTCREHKVIFVATDKNSASLPDIEAQIRNVHGDSAQVITLARGRIKGVNTAGNCTLAYLTGMSLFTTLDDAALHAAISMRHTLPQEPHVLDKLGNAAWNAAGPRLKAMRNFYALRALDELYQAIWRTAVRRGGTVECIIAVPDPSWLIALWRTVMPQFRLGRVYRNATKADALPAVTLPGGTVIPGQAVDFVQDEQMNGLRIVHSETGTVFPKTTVAEMFGYTGETGWKDHKKQILGWIGEFFDEQKTALIRKQNAARAPAQDELENRIVI